MDYKHCDALDIYYSKIVVRIDEIEKNLKETYKTVKTILQDVNRSDSRFKFIHDEERSLFRSNIGFYVKGQHDIQVSVTYGEIGGGVWGTPATGIPLNHIQSTVGADEYIPLPKNWYPSHATSNNVPGQGSRKTSPEQAIDGYRVPKHDPDVQMSNRKSGDKYILIKSCYLLVI